MSIKNTKNLIHDRSVVHNMGYHIVWAVKYRRKNLTGEIESSLKEILTDKKYIQNQKTKAGTS
jgi:putative transposase